MKNIPAGIVFKDDTVLLVLRRFPPLAWGPPGGFVDRNEEFCYTAKREVWEETGITCETLCRFEREYAFKEFNANLILFICKYISGDLRCSYESKNVAWFPIGELPQPLSPKEDVFFEAYDIFKKVTCNP